MDEKLFRLLNAMEQITSLNGAPRWESSETVEQNDL
jgi:hypothetical protein